MFVRTFSVACRSPLHYFAFYNHCSVQTGFITVSCFLSILALRTSWRLVSYKENLCKLVAFLLPNCIILGLADLSGENTKVPNFMFVSFKRLQEENSIKVFVARCLVASIELVSIWRCDSDAKAVVMTQIEHIQIKKECFHMCDETHRSETAAQQNLKWFSKVIFRLQPGYFFCRVAYRAAIL